MYNTLKRLYVIEKRITIKMLETAVSKGYITEEEKDELIRLRAEAEGIQP